MPTSRIPHETVSATVDANTSQLVYSLAAVAGRMLMAEVCHIHFRLTKGYSFVVMWTAHL